MRRSTRAALIWTIIAVCTVAALGLLGHIWAGWPADPLLWKLVITCFILAALLTMVVAVGQYLTEEEDQRKDGFLN